MYTVPAVITDRFGARWLYQYGHMYGSPDGRTLRHGDSFRT